MDKNKVKLSLCKYKIKKMELIYGEKEKTKYQTIDNSLITEMMITEDFENFYFPYFVITISIPNKIYRTIIKPNISNTLRMKINIQKGKFKETNTLTTSKNVSFKTCLNKKFRVFIGPNSVDLTEKQQKAIEKFNNQYGQLTTITMLLYNEDYYQKYDRVVNASLGGVNLTDVFSYILEQAKIKDVLMSPSTNSRTYDQFIVKPLSLCDNLMNLCNEYSLHKKGTLVYFGLDKMYLVDKTPKCTAFKTGETTLIYIAVASKGDGVTQAGGCYENNKDGYGVLNSVDIGFENNSNVAKKVGGSNTVIVNDSGKVTKTNKKAKNITNVVVGNENASAMKRGISESKKILSCQFTNADFTMFQPNKLYMVSIDGSEYKKYNGKYRLVHVSHVFSKEGEYFSAATIAQFKG